MWLVKDLHQIWKYDVTKLRFLMHCYYLTFHITDMSASVMSALSLESQTDNSEEQQKRYNVCDMEAEQGKNVIE